MNSPTKSDLIGRFYNDEYLLDISENDVQLRTNIGTEHKPFYTDILFNEKYEFKLENNKIKISQNLYLLPPSNYKIKIKLVISSTVTFINLLRFT